MEEEKIKETLKVISNETKYVMASIIHHNIDLFQVGEVFPDDFTINQFLNLFSPELKKVGDNNVLSFHCEYPNKEFFMEVIFALTSDFYIYNYNVSFFKSKVNG